jgi:uncharacterized membrane protein YesL
LNQPGEEQELFGDEAPPRRAVPRPVMPLVPLGRALRDWGSNILILSMSVVLWVLLSFTIVGGPPAGAALFCVARAVVLHEGPDLRLFFKSLRAYFWRSWQLALAGLLGLLILVADLKVYPSMVDPGGFFSTVVGIIVLYVGLMWLTTLFYAWPLLVSREDFNLVHLLRNGFVIAARYPANSLISVAFIALLLFATYFLPPIGVIIMPALVPLLALNNLYALVPGLVPKDSLAYEEFSQG